MPLKRALARTMASAFDDEYLRVRRKKKYLWFRFHIVRKLGSEINFFLNIFFMALVVFCWVICSRVPTSILTRDVYFLWMNLGNLFQ
jgi:hypothetical protein